MSLGKCRSHLGHVLVCHLGWVKANWSKLNMKFLHHGQVVELWGEPTFTDWKISAANLRKLKEVEPGRVFGEQRWVQRWPEWSSPWSSKGRMRTRGSNYSIGQFLSHRRECLCGARWITIYHFSGTPKSVGPYRYNNNTNNEMEHPVKEILVARIIQPSSSHFLKCSWRYFQNSNSSYYGLLWILGHAFRPHKCANHLRLQSTVNNLQRPHLRKFALVF